MALVLYSLVKLSYGQCTDYRTDRVQTRLENVECRIEFDFGTLFVKGSLFSRRLFRVFKLPEILSDNVSYISVRRFWYAVTVNGSLKTVFSISIIPELVQYVSQILLYSLLLGRVCPWCGDTCPVSSE